MRQWVYETSRRANSECRTVCGAEISTDHRPGQGKAFAMRWKEEFKIQNCNLKNGHVLFISEGRFLSRVVSGQSKKRRHQRDSQSRRKGKMKKATHQNKFYLCNCHANQMGEQLCVGLFEAAICALTWVKTKKQKDDELLSGGFQPHATVYFWCCLFVLMH